MRVVLEPNQDGRRSSVLKWRLTMIDYNFVVMARGEHEERVRKIEEELLARQNAVVRPGRMDRMLYGLGEWLEKSGARLKTQHATVRTAHTYQGGHAG